MAEKIRIEDSSDFRNVVGRETNGVTADVEKNFPRKSARFHNSASAESGISSGRHGSQINTEFQDRIGMGLPRGRNLELDDEFNRESTNCEKLACASRDFGKIDLQSKIMFDGSCETSVEDFVARIRVELGLKTFPITNFCWPCHFFWKALR